MTEPKLRVISENDSLGKNIHLYRITYGTFDPEIEDFKNLGEEIVTGTFRAVRGYVEEQGGEGSWDSNIECYSSELNSQGKIPTIIFEDGFDFNCRGIDKIILLED